MAKKVLDADEDVEVSSDGFVEEFCTKPTFDEDGVQATAGIGRDGKEYGDPVPMAPPVGFSAPPDLMEMMRNMIRSEEIQRRLDAEGFDTEEEAADFDVDDDPLPPLTFHEALFVKPAAEPSASSPPASSPATAGTGEAGGVAGGSPDTPPAPAPSDVKPSTSSS